MFYWRKIFTRTDIHHAVMLKFCQLQVNYKVKSPQSQDVTLCLAPSEDSN